MRLPLCSAYPMLLFVLLGTSAEISFNPDAFVNATLAIRKFYSASSVIFIHPEDKYGDYGDLKITHLIHTSCRLLNRHDIMTVNVHFKKLRSTLRYYNQIVQPISIVILPNLEAYLDFAKITKNYPMSFSVWFMLFLYTPNNSTHDHCHEPIGNPFNLAFNTQMLVSCHNMVMLREWYSVKGDTVKMFDLAKWDSEFIFLTDLSLYERRNNMEGVVLRAVTLEDMSVLTKFTGNYVAFMFEKVLEELTYSLNFTLKIVSRMTEHGVRDRQNFNWSGVMGEVIYNRADFGIADMSSTSFRTLHVDFTLPLIISKYSLYIKEPEICSVRWLGYFQTFNWRTWTMIVILIAITTLLLSFMKAYCESRGAWMYLLSENFISIWGIFCQQTYIEIPKSSSLFLAYFTLFLTAWMIMSHYSAGLVCLLTTCTGVLPFRSIEEFADDGTYKLIIPPGTAEYDVLTFQADYEAKSFSIKLLKLMKDKSQLPRNLMEGFMQVCEEGKVAYMVLSALKESVEQKIPCKLSSISSERIDNLGMILSKGNPYTGLINYHLQRFLDNGVIMRLKNMRLVQEAENNIRQDYEPVNLVNIVPVLTILYGGFIISIMLVIIEKIHSRSRRGERRKREKEKRKFQSRAFHPSRKLFIEKYYN